MHPQQSFTTSNQIMATQQSFTINSQLQASRLTFTGDNGERTGSFDFGKSPVTFEGNATNSAHTFVKSVQQYLGDFLQKTRNETKEACAKTVDHILKEGGGTYGDFIRKTVHG